MLIFHQCSPSPCLWTTTVYLWTAMPTETTTNCLLFTLCDANDLQHFGVGAQGSYDPEI